MIEIYIEGVCLLTCNNVIQLRPNLFPHPFPKSAFSADYPDYSVSFEEVSWQNNDLLREKLIDILLNKESVINNNKRCGRSRTKKRIKKKQLKK